MKTNYYLQGKDAESLLVREPQRGQVVLFIRGTGEVTVDRDVFSVTGIAALCPAGPGPICLRASSGALEYLEILTELEAHDSLLARSPDSYFVDYAQCEPYAEAIKSPKTISRTIVPPNILPRFCLGSVETTGPDAVGAHSHPMLEQLFFGLPGNRCIVTADDEEAVLEEGMLLHIPLGSRHGVRVEEGSQLHYVWMDFFRREADLGYIQEQHKPLRSNSSDQQAKPRTRP